MELAPLGRAGDLPNEGLFGAILAIIRDHEAIDTAYREFDARRDEANKAVDRANALIADITAREAALTKAIKGVETRAAEVEKLASTNNQWAEKLAADKQAHEQKVKTESRELGARAKEARTREENLVAREAQAKDDLDEAREMKAAAAKVEDEYNTKLAELRAITQGKGG